MTRHLARNCTRDAALSGTYAGYTQLLAAAGTLL